MRIYMNHLKKSNQFYHLEEIQYYEFIKWNLAKVPL